MTTVDGVRAAILERLGTQIPPRKELPTARAYPGVYAYKTAQGTRYRYNFRDSDGKQSCRRGFASAQAASADKASSTVLAAAGVLHLRTARFEEYFESWLAGHEPFIDPGTWKDYRTHGRKRLIPEFGTMRLDEIATADVREWLAETSRSGTYKPKTLNNALGVLVVCLNQATDDRLLQTNPAARVRRLPLEHVERQYLRIHEIDIYLSCCSSTYRPLAELLISCGLRISEALGLTWADIDFHNGTVMVNRQPKGARGETGATKGRRARTVEAGPDLLRTLATLKAQREEVHGDLQPQAVFTMPVRRAKADRGRWQSAGEPTTMDRNTVSRDWHKAALQDAGLRDMPLHALRHTAAATWLYCGQPLIYVQRALGHASITTTKSVYGHLEQSLLKTAARNTEAAVRSAGRGVAHR